jgi:2,3-bisphosphoglycerate-independent phosphoglycerate mutase
MLVAEQGACQPLRSSHLVSLSNVLLYVFPLQLSSILSPLQDLKFVGMMQYDGDLLLPANYLVPPPEIHKTSGEFLVHNGISTFACSETQKFGHVTFFWNGNRSGYFDSNLETYLEVCVLLYSCALLAAVLLAVQDML